MTDLLLIFMAGLMGSSHCVGMCGGFAVIVGMRGVGSTGMAAVQSAFTVGRIFTYATMGAVAGAIGARATAFSWYGIHASALLSIVGGALLLIQGISTLGLKFLPARFHTHGACLLASGYRSLLQGSGWPGVFLAGMFTGMLPCGLVYGFVSLATATADPLRGGLVMATFGLGTAPLMIATGWGGALLSGVARERLLKLAALCVVLMGTITFARGFSHLNSPADGGRPACPFCLDER